MPTRQTFQLGVRVRVQDFHLVSLAPGFWYGLPILECRFDSETISRLAVVGVLLDRRTRSCKTPTPRRSDSILPENLGQRDRKLALRAAT